MKKVFPVQAMNSFTSDIFSKVTGLQQENVVFRDKEELEKKLTSLVTDGATKLQVIADYDSTLTKSHVDGKPTLHTYDVLARVETLSQRYLEGFKSLYLKYNPKACSKDICDEERQKVLDEWWVEHELLARGENVTAEAIRRTTDAVNTPLREGCEKTLLLLNKHNIPVTVLSAGVGDVIAYVLQDFQVQIVSNFIEYKDGKIVAFKKPTVSVYNKDKIPFQVDESRHNVIVLGDSLGDCNMADNLTNTKTILKIGFLAGSDKDEKVLENYRRCFDIVLLEDQTMHALTTLLELITDPS